MDQDAEEVHIMSGDGAGLRKHSRLILVRHTQVASEFSSVCYGASDVALSEKGETHARELAVSLARERPDFVIHSGLSRARFLASEIANHAGVDLSIDARLQEMNFGSWELRPWDDIFREDGDGLARLIDEPDTFCPPNGETAHQVRDRMVAWVSQLPLRATIIAVGHGGAISALRGTLQGVPSSNWSDLMPAFGEMVRIPLPI